MYSYTVHYYDLRNCTLYMLQSEYATLSSSTNLIISVIDQLKILRTDKEFNKFFEQFNREISNKRKHVLSNLQFTSWSLSTIKI